MLLGRYLLRRLLLAGPTLLGVLFITFALTRIIPGNPIDRMVGFFVSDERRAEIMREHGLDQPYHIQFVRYLGGGLAGRSGADTERARHLLKQLFGDIALRADQHGLVAELCGNLNATVDVDSGGAGRGI